MRGRPHKPVPPRLQASCHCGAVRIELARKPRTLTECNCSICRRYGARWAYCTRASVEIHASAGAFSTYQGRYRTFEYHVCRRCGCVTHYRRVNTTNDDRIAVNARMIDPDAVADIRVRQLDVRKKKKPPRPA